MLSIVHAPGQPVTPFEGEAARNTLARARSAMVQYYERFSEDHPHDFDLLTPELPNIALCLAYCREAQDWLSLSVIAHNAGQALLNVGHGSLLLQSLEAALFSQTRDAGSGLGDVYVVLLGDYAGLLNAAGERQRAFSIYQDILAQSQDDPLERIFAHFGLAAIHLGMENQAEAQAHWIAGRDIARAINDTSLEAAASYFLEDSGDHTDVLAVTEQTAPQRQQGSFQLWRRYLQRHFQAFKLLQKAEFDKAQALYLDVINLADTLQEQDGKALALFHLGEIARITGQINEAKHYFRLSEEIALSLDSHTGLASICAGLGKLHLFEGEYELARPYLEECVMLEAEWGETTSLAENLYWLGYAVANTGEPTAAQTIFLRARTIFSRLDAGRVADVDLVLERLAAAAAGSQ